MIYAGEKRSSCNACGASDRRDGNIDAKEICFRHNFGGMDVSLCKKCRGRAIIVLQEMGYDEENNANNLNEG